MREVKRNWVLKNMVEEAKGSHLGTEGVASDFLEKEWKTRMVCFRETVEVVGVALMLVVLE